MLTDIILIASCGGGVESVDPSLFEMTTGFLNQ
jgi:hypothetical protein